MRQPRRRRRARRHRVPPAPRARWPRWRASTRCSRSMSAARPAWRCCTAAGAIRWTAGRPSPDDIERALDDEPPPDPPRGGAPPEGGGRSEPTPAEGGAQAPSRERREPPAPARLPAEALRVAGTGSGPGGRRARSSGEGAGAIDCRPAARRERRRLDRRDAAAHGWCRATRPACGSTCAAAARACCCAWSWTRSGSMGARRRLARVKGALLASLRDAYERRDRVAVVAFRGSDAQVLVPPGAPLESAAEAIRGLPTGGRTPLAAGLALAEQVIRARVGPRPRGGAHRRDPDRRPCRGSAGRGEPGGGATRPGGRCRTRHRHRGRPRSPRARRARSLTPPARACTR